MNYRLFEDGGICLNEDDLQSSVFNGKPIFILQVFNKAISDIQPVFLMDFAVTFPAEVLEKTPYKYFTHKRKCDINLRTRFLRELFVQNKHNVYNYQKLSQLRTFDEYIEYIKDYVHNSGRSIPIMDLIDLDEAISEYIRVDEKERIHLHYTNIISCFNDITHIIEGSEVWNVILDISNQMYKLHCEKNIKNFSIFKAKIIYPKTLKR